MLHSSFVLNEEHIYLYIYTMTLFFFIKATNSHYRTPDQFPVLDWAGPRLDQTDLRSFLDRLRSVRVIFDKLLRAETQVVRNSETARTKFGASGWQWHMSVATLC